MPPPSPPPPRARTRSAMAGTERRDTLVGSFPPVKLLPCPSCATARSRACAARACGAHDVLRPLHQPDARPHSVRLGACSKLPQAPPRSSWLLTGRRQAARQVNAEGTELTWGDAGRGASLESSLSLSEVEAIVRGHGTKTLQKNKARRGPQEPAQGCSGFEGGLVGFEGDSGSAIAAAIFAILAQGASHPGVHSVSGSCPAAHLAPASYLQAPMQCPLPIYPAARFRSRLRSKPRYRPGFRPGSDPVPTPTRLRPGTDPVPTGCRPGADPVPTAGALRAAGAVLCSRHGGAHAGPAGALLPYNSASRTIQHIVPSCTTI